MMRSRYAGTSSQLSSVFFTHSLDAQSEPRANILSCALVWAFV
jgi:hypothetical protein